jgi:hypothetical protein
MSGHFNDYAPLNFSAVDFQVVSPTITTESFSGKVRRVGQGHQYYVFGVKFPPMTSYQFGPVNAFIARQYGQVDSWTVALPEISYNTGSNAASIGTPVVTATLAAGIKTCTISGMVVNKTQVLRAGDFFKFNNAGHTKVYMAVDDLNSGSGGTGTLNFAGGLVTAVPSGTGITTNAVPFTVILDGDVQEFNVGLGGMTDFSFKCREVW